MNAPAAEHLHAKVGDTVRIAFFEPESIDGQVREKTVSLRLAAIVRLSDAANDRASRLPSKGSPTSLRWPTGIRPFPSTRIESPVDEQYWRQHGPTPKAFVSLETGRELWGSRFGQATSIRVGNRAEGGGWKAEGGKEEAKASNPQFPVSHRLPAVGPHPSPLPTNLRSVPGEGTGNAPLPEGEGDQKREPVRAAPTSGSSRSGGDGPCRPARQSPSLGGLCRHHAIRRALCLAELLPDRGGDDACGGAVSPGCGAKGRANRHFHGRGHVASQNPPHAVDRRAGRGWRRKHARAYRWASATPC